MLVSGEDGLRALRTAIAITERVQRAQGALRKRSHEQPRRVVTVAATQFACSWDLPANLERAERLVRAAHARGAQIILLQELFATPYFCIEQDARHLQLAAERRRQPVAAPLRRPGGRARGGAADQLL